METGYLHIISVQLPYELFQFLKVLVFAAACHGLWSKDKVIPLQQWAESFGEESELFGDYNTSVPSAWGKAKRIIRACRTGKG